MKYAFYFITLFWAWGADAQSTAKIFGKVSNKYSDAGIPQARVEILQTRFQTVTDSNGYFELTNLNIASGDLQISASGYQNELISHATFVADKSLEYNASLIPISDRMGAVNIASKSYDNSPQNPVSAYSFSREEISMNPGAQGDIFRAIGMLPGVTSSGGVYSAISVRGQGVRDNVYMVDDIPVTEIGHLEGNSFFNDPNGGRFSLFAPRVIEKAQFQGGGFGPEFGRRSASYLGLTIKEGNKGNAIVDGQMDLLGVTLNYDGPTRWKKTTLFLSARYQNFYALVNLIGLKDIGLPRYGDLVLKTSTQLNAKNKLTGIFIYSPERYTRDIENVKADKFLNNVYLPDFNRKKMIAGLNVKSQLNRTLQWKNVIYYTHYLSDVLVGKATPSVDSLGARVGETISYRNNIQQQNYQEHKLGYRSIITQRWSPQTYLTAGFEADRMLIMNERKQNELDTQFIYYRGQTPVPNQNYLLLDPRFVNASFNKSAGNASAYTTFGFSPLPGVSLNLGARYDYTGYTKEHLISPRLSGSVHLTKGHSLNFGAGTYYQDPVYSDIADQGEQRRLLNERTQQVVIGYKWLLKDGWKIILEGWHKQFSNLVVKPNLGYPFQENSGVGFGRGLDINVSKKMTHRLGGQVGYSYIETKRKDAATSYWYDFIFSQPHQFNLLINYKLKEHIVVSVKYRYASGRPKDDFIIHENVFNNNQYYRYSKEIIALNSLRLPNFSSLDFRVNYSFRYRKINMTGFMDIVNVQNQVIPNFENFNSYTGKPYYEGLAIFPSGGLKFEF
ncbi:MAG: carboxypeptidase regulatory-like domain-containing protein [Bacteroidota bacterium]